MLVHKKNLYHLLLACMPYRSSEDPDKTSHPPQTHLSKEAGVRNTCPRLWFCIIRCLFGLCLDAQRVHAAVSPKPFQPMQHLQGDWSDLYSLKLLFCVSHSISSLIGLDRYFFRWKFFRWRRWSSLKTDWCRTVTFPIFQWRQFLLWTILSIHQRLFWFNTIT